MPKESLKDKLDGNELDLGLSNLTTVPVKDLVSIMHLNIGVLVFSCISLTFFSQLIDFFMNFEEQHVILFLKTTSIECIVVIFFAYG